jgi:ADP-ribosylglycohydrolase
VESLTTNNGLVDPVNINARLGFLINGGSRQWMSDATAEGIRLAGEHDGLVPESYQPEPELAVAVRGVPVGLLHAVGGLDLQSLVAEASLVSRLSHAGPAQAELTSLVAKAVNQAGRSRSVEQPRETSANSAEEARLVEIISVVNAAGSFERAVSDAVGLGGLTDASGAIAGAIAGASFGASGIPQQLIDGLDARIYLTLAAPWFYRTAVRRAGTVIDLRVVE